MMQLSVIICTHNRERLLSETLTSLNFAQRPADFGVEIVVVANGCTDGSMIMLQEYAARQAQEGLLQLRAFEEPRLGKSYALNTAIQLDLAPLVAFVDDDQAVDPGFLEGIRVAAECYVDSDLFCGKIHPDWTGVEPKWVHHKGPYPIFPTPVPTFDLGDASQIIVPDTMTPSGGNLIVRREWLARVGPFSIDLGPTGHNLLGGEDVEWVKRALAAGAVLRYIPEVRQLHYVDTERITMPYLLRKALERSCSVILFSPQHQAVKHVPAYLARKLSGHILTAIFTLDSQKRRHFMLRIAATLGEIKGFYKLTHANKRRAVTR